jgi:hypothetical protein
MLRNFSAAMLVAAALAACSAQRANATGLATCDSGPPDKWQSQDKLATTLKEKGWQIRNIKVDGGCYEVYAIDEKGEKLEAYFHPVTFERIPFKEE